ncbi:YciI family protein [Bacillus sp. JCM 19034]|uniref:YciI family protein n=1 Tax=Bacillus sp. JCM 19034 TaxID=1481928 RepID=UPI00078220DE|nr:YciI family protein [Bacillus sp. JCM 19034]
MAYFAAILHMEKPELNQQYRKAHLDYLGKRKDEGKVFAMGPFVDGTGGMVIYEADSIDEAKQIASEDPYILAGVRRLELHEWGMLK